MFMNHSGLKYLVNKPMLWGNIFCWLLIFQEFDFEIIVKLGHLDDGPNHLSQIETCEEPTNIEDGLPDGQFLRVDMVDYYYDQIIQFLATRPTPEDLTTSQKKQLVVKTSDFQLIMGNLYKLRTR